MENLSSNDSLGMGSLKMIIFLQCIFFFVGLCLVAIHNLSGVDIGNYAYGVGLLAGFLFLVFVYGGGIYTACVIVDIIYTLGIKKQKTNRYLATLVIIFAIILSSSILFLIGKVI